jgi:hypothetical protein
MIFWSQFIIINFNYFNIIVIFPNFFEKNHAMSSFYYCFEITYLSLFRFSMRAFCSTGVRPPCPSDGAAGGELSVVSPFCGKMSSCSLTSSPSVHWTPFSRVLSISVISSVFGAPPDSSSSTLHQLSSESDNVFSVGKKIKNQQNSHGQQRDEAGDDIFGTNGRP